MKLLLATVVSSSPAHPKEEEKLTRYRDSWADLMSSVRQGTSWSGNERNRCLLNLAGKQFADASALSGLDFNDDGRALAVCDWNRDGKLDLWLRNRSAPRLRLMLNQSESQTSLSLRLQGVDPSKPVFAHLGFDFPHTPVLPPPSYRERFQKKTYKIPAVIGDELETMPKQMRNAVENGFTDHYPDSEKHSMIQDYFAFCAYGDSLVGKAVDDFVAYSEKQKQTWMIVYVCGDHGWKLNDHGSVSKTTPWRIDTLNPVIVVSSDKTAFPAGKVVKSFTEFVDLAPTMIAAGGADLSQEQYAHLDGRDLKKVASNELPARQYVVGESHASTGPRAFIRTKDYYFSMKTRPNTVRGENMDWALKASYAQVDPGLYHFPSDPKEVKNLAFDEKHQKVAMQLKKKLTNIVFGDGRIEVDWGDNKALGTQVFRAENFAPGANDGKLELP